WPTRGSGKRWSAISRRLSGVDLREDLRVLGEAVGLLVGVGLLAVDEDFEDAAHALVQRGGDAVFLFDRGLQTGGLGEVVSLPAVLDPDLHWPSSPVRRSSRSPGTLVTIIR